MVGVSWTGRYWMEAREIDADVCGFDYICLIDHRQFQKQHRSMFTGDPTAPRGEISFRRFLATAPRSKRTELDDLCATIFPSIPLQ